jgi:hypothetical protein
MFDVFPHFLQFLFSSQKLEGGGVPGLPLEKVGEISFCYLSVVGL